MQMSPDPASNYPGRTYRYFTGPILWDFGYGLSYTSFNMTWDDSDVTLSTQNPLEQLSFEVTITNIGNVAGGEVAMVYMEFSNDPHGEKKRLFGFQKVYLQPKESKKVFITTLAEAFAIVDDRGDKYLIPETKKILLTNGHDIQLRKNIMINGEKNLLHRHRGSEDVIA